MAHEFEVKVRWTEGLQGQVTATGVDRTVPFAVPKEFGGPGGELTPEHFYAAAVNACVAATFFSTAAQTKLAFRSYESTASATMEKTEKGLRMTRVELRPRIVVASEADRGRADKLIHKAESFCPISGSVTAEVTLVPTIEVAG